MNPAQRMELLEEKLNHDLEFAHAMSIPERDPAYLLAWITFTQANIRLMLAVQRATDE